MSSFAKPLLPMSHLTARDFESSAILKATASASRQLAELKGLAAAIPNQGILINSLVLQEAKDSSEIENIITTHDELFRSANDPEQAATPAAKEVRNYVQALRVGHTQVKKSGLLTINHILQIQAELEQNYAGFRKLPGTALKSSAGEVVYTPLMGDLERFINDDASFDADPLIKMALIHHQFESIHPFYDGNGRTGRIINVLYLVNKGLLDTPVLYLSRHIMRTKPTYYRLLQAVREHEGVEATALWQEWVLYMLTAVEQTAAQTIHTVRSIRDALQDYKHRIRADYKFYSQDLINNLFMHPYTKIDFVERDLKVTRLTAARYLDALAAGGLLKKLKIGRSSYYVNVSLNAILTRQDAADPEGISVKI
jgi:Fic family protein